VRARATGLFLLPLLVLFGCGDDDDGADGAAATSTTSAAVPSNAGDLTEADCVATVDQVAAAVGLPVSFTDVVDSGDGAWCSFAHEDGLTTVNVDSYETTGAAAIEGAGDAYADAEAVTTVQGADEAVWSAENGALVARTGDRAVRVFVVGPDIELDDPLGAAVVIAEAALGLDAPPEGGSDDGAAALELLRSYEDECAAHADSTGNTRIDPVAFANAEVLSGDGDGGVLIEDGTGNRLVADLELGTFSGEDGPTGPLPGTYAFSCPPDLFVGTVA
jgi:hypothetical protein